MIDWDARLIEWRARFPITTRPPLSPERIDAALAGVGPAPDDLRGFYLVTNGLYYEWFEMLPIEDFADIRKTWNSLQRANDPAKTKFLGRDESLLRRFAIFAQLDGLNCAAYDRHTGTIWYEEDNALHELLVTDLPQFIELCLREVQDL